MTLPGIVQLALYLAVLLALVKPLGWFMARVYTGKPCGLDRVLGPFERLFYRVSGVDSKAEMSWKEYAKAVLVFSALGLFSVYGLQRGQALLPLNPQALGAITPDSSFNTSVSFVTNTNWQGYGGEVTMSYLSQMLALGTQNFVSAATGMAVLVALIRGLSRRSAFTIGNFWVDLTRSTLYILLPLSCILALALVSQGVVQSLKPSQTVSLVQPILFEQSRGDQGEATHTVRVTEQVLPLGPAASQIAIKQLGTNGGGFFNVNSAHPFENPTPFSNFLEVLAILLIPAALCWTFGEMIGDRRQGWAVLAAMTAIFTVLLLACTWAESAANPAITAFGVDSTFGAAGNMEGKEVRFGIANSALWATATTAASNGSVNAMHDSFTPLSGLVPMWLMQLGEVVFGGVGCGLYGMLMFVIVAVFIAGLMVGRTPEYLGKKIEPFEMKMAALAVLMPCALVLLGTAVAVVVPQGQTTSNPGAHGFSQILYAFSSASNNNGSAFAGLSANTPFYNTALGVCMFLSRFWLIVPVLAIAGSLASKKGVPATAGTLPTHTPVFIGMLICVVIIVGALTFVPALALGPIVEQLQLQGH
ncbi:MAG: potassium-transporting ATPase subunit KdpA [Planctomycetes bacterium]|nr:potassium-transporting ATPase subunit KdpA [Planctomycetota bacterium]